MTRAEVKLHFDNKRLTQKTICISCGKRYGSHTLIRHSSDKEKDIIKCKDGGTVFTLEEEERYLYEEITGLLTGAQDYLKTHKTCY